MHFKLGRSGRVIMVGLACCLLSLGSVRAQSLPSNFSAIKAQMRVFEAVIDGTMAQTFAPPFGLLEKTKGTYLPNFGLAFSLEVNLYPLRIPSPFSPAPLSKAELEKGRQAKAQRIAIIKQSVPQLLADHAMSLRDLTADNYIAVVVHLFDMQGENDGFPGQLVIQTKKSDLDQLWDKKISYQEWVTKIMVLEL